MARTSFTVSLLCLLWQAPPLLADTAEPGEPLPPIVGQPIITLETLLPPPTSLHVRLVRARKELARAQAMATALVRIHNRWAELLATHTAPTSCEANPHLPLLRRSPLLLEAWRDAAQSARAEWARLERLAADRALQSVWTEDDRNELEHLRTEIAEQAPAWMEARAWQEQLVTPTLQRCPGAPTAGPGLGEMQQPVAVLGVGGGWICPGDIPAQQVVVVLDDPRACWGELDCACLAEPVLPGAVLGPEVDSEMEGRPEDAAPEGAPAP